MIFCYDIDGLEDNKDRLLSEEKIAETAGRLIDSSAAAEKAGILGDKLKAVGGVDIILREMGVNNGKHNT